MGISAKEAAGQVGLTKQGIIKALHSGKISGAKDSNGEWVIEPCELFRVYTPVDSNGNSQVDAGNQVAPERDTGSFQVENNQLRERLREKDDVIADLRARLDAESDERRRLSMLLTATAPAKPGLWARIFGGR